MTIFSINSRSIGPGKRTYIVAEMSANHHGDKARAHAIVEAAASAGADAVKLQTYTPDTLTIDSDKEPFRIRGGTVWDGRNLHNLLAEAMTPWEWHADLVEHANRLGMDCFSSPFDESAVDFLSELDVPAFKIASFEITHLPLLRKVAGTGRPVILSTGIATLADIELATNTLRDAGAKEVALLRCTSAYPAPPELARLKMIPHLRETFHVASGLSDHTLGIAVPVAAVALGASIIEKHFTLSREDVGPDSAFSLEPDEFRTMVEQVRVAEVALGEVDYALSDKQLASRAYARSIFVVGAVERGERIHEKHLRIVRPGHGLHPRHWEEAIGRIARRRLEPGDPLTWADLEPE